MGRFRIILFLILFIVPKILFSQDTISDIKPVWTEDIDFLVPTFRGNAERNFYGWGKIREAGCYLEILSG